MLMSDEYLGGHDSSDHLELVVVTVVKTGWISVVNLQTIPQVLP